MRKSITAVTLLIVTVLLCSGLFTCPVAGDSGSAAGVRPAVKSRASGFVPDDSTAIKIAEAIWLPIFGPSIYEKKPFRAELTGDSVWHVIGKIQGDSVDGGVIHAWIRKSDCCILGVNREK